MRATHAITDKPIVTPRDYRIHPFIVIWETTRACALQCVHCRAEAQFQPHPNQLTGEEGKRLIAQIAELEHPLLVFTGGDPLMRPDLYELIRYAVNEHGLSVSMTPSATPRVTRSAVQQAAEAGLSRWAFSLDGSCDTIHDHFRGTPGSFQRTMQGIGYLQELQVPIQINTTVSRYNLHDLPHIAELIKSMKVVLWSLFFLIPTGRADASDMITAQEHEQVMRWLCELRGQMPYGIKATEAPHYRRVVIQQAQQGDDLRKQRHSIDVRDNREAGMETNAQQVTIIHHTDANVPIINETDHRPADCMVDNSGLKSSTASSVTQAPRHADLLGRAPQSVNDGDGFVFISHTGEVYPSGFLPLSCGNIRHTPLADIYRQSPIMQQLRDKSLLKGKCGVCSYKAICGGSRARAYSITGDYLQSDPACAYVPAGWLGEKI